MRQLTETELAQVAADYHEFGFAYIRSIIAESELAPLTNALDDGAAPGSFSVTDSHGGKQELSVWLDLADDFVGVIPRLQPIVDVAVATIGEPVCHWHSKLSWKRPHTTSLWDWHQDYAFWRGDGVARPDMCTIAIAVGPVTKANGCMQLVSGSHHLGALPIVDVGESQGTDPDAVTTALETHPLEQCELAPGDLVVFHSNMVHGSGENTSDTPRTMLMMSYNAASNPPMAPRHAGYTPKDLDVLPATALAEGWSDVFGETVFVDPVDDDLDQGYDIG